MDYITDVLISGEGYSYKHVTEDEARKWVKEHPHALYVIHDKDELDRMKIRTLLQLPGGIELNKNPLDMKPREEALVIRKYISPYHDNPRAKGKPTPQRIKEWEYGVLKRIS